MWPFKRKPKVVEMRLGDQLVISVKGYGTRNILTLHHIQSEHNGPTQAVFLSQDAFLT